MSHYFTSMRIVAVVFLMLVSGCVAKVGDASNEEEYLNELAPSNSEDVIDPPALRIQIDRGEPTLELPQQCRCEWRVWNSSGLLCAGVVCSEACTAQQRFCNEQHACVPR